MLILIIISIIAIFNVILNNGLLYYFDLSVILNPLAFAIASKSLYNSLKLLLRIII